MCAGTGAAVFTMYDYLAEFVVVAETGSLSEAASRLSLSQPTISKHLGSLESELGCRLVVRTPHGNELTPSGVAVLEVGKRLSDIGEEVERVVRQNQSLAVLQFVDSLSLFRQVFRAFRQFETEERPDLRVHLDQERYFGGPAPALEAGIDLVVYLESGGVEPPRGSVCVELGMCPFSAVVSSSNPLAGQASLRLADLHGQRLARLTGSSSVLNHTWQVIRLKCAAAGINPNPVTHKVFHPAEVLDIALLDDEVFILPSDSQSVSGIGVNPDLRCIPLVDFDQRLVAAYRADNAAAAQLCKVLAATQ